MPGLKYTITAETGQATAAMQQFAASASKSFAQTTAAATAFNAATNQTAFTAATLTNGAKATSAGLHALGRAAQAVGFQIAPQMTVAVTAATGVIKDLSKAAGAAGISLGAMGAALAAIAGAVLIGNEARKTGTSLLDEQKAMAALAQQNEALAKTIRSVAEARREAGRMTPEEFEAFLKKLNEARALPTLQESAKALRPLSEALMQNLPTLEEFKKIREANNLEIEHSVAVTELLTLASSKQAESDLKRTTILEALKTLESQRANVSDALRAGLIDEARQRELELEDLQQEISLKRELKALAVKEIEDDFRLTDAQKFSRLNELGASPLGPDPNSRIQQLQAAVVNLQNQWGTVAQNIAAGFSSVIGGAVDSISAGISGLILQTKTWSQALAQIGTSILTGIVNAIVQMGVRWIATQLLMATVGKSIMAAGLAANIPIAAAQTALWSTPAVLATIASYGSAAAAAPAFIAVAQGISLAESLAQFAEGGRPPIGRPSLVGERGPELFIPDQPGRILSHSDTMSAIRSGGAGAGAERGRQLNQTIHNYVDREAWLNAVRDDIEGIAIEAFSRNRHRFAI